MLSEINKTIFDSFITLCKKAEGLDPGAGVSLQLNGMKTPSFGERSPVAIQAAPPSAYILDLLFLWTELPEGNPYWSEMYNKLKKLEE